MKKLSNHTLLIIAFFSVLFISSCTKNKGTTPPTPKGLLYFHMHSNIDTNEVGAGDIAKDADGRRYQLDVAQFYISGITLHKADGSTVVLSKAYVLKDIDGEEYFADSVATGNYVSVSFNVGVDATTNLNTPSSYPSTSPLSTQTPAMWFGTTTQGYIFMNIQGKADTTATQTGAVNFPFSYQLGTSGMLKTVALPAKAFSVIANQPAIVHLTADFGKALHGVIFKTNSTATPWVNTAVATQIADNIADMFEYED